MPGLEILLWLIGAFYAFAGFVAARAALTSRLLDQAIAAIEGKKPDRVETMQSNWLIAAAVVIAAAGLALMFLLDISVWLFLASAAGQALYLLYLAPRIFDAHDAPDAAGRRQTFNAFVIYIAATALVVWAYLAGKLVSVEASSPAALTIPALLVAALVIYVVRAASRSMAPGRSSGVADLVGDTDEAAPGPDPAQSQRIKVMADYHCHPLWALDPDCYGDIAPEALGLSPELTRDLDAWAEAYTASISIDDPETSLRSDAEAAAHAAMARPLAVRLARERPDRTIFVEDDEAGVVEVHADEVRPSKPGGDGAR